MRLAVLPEEEKDVCNSSGFPLKSVHRERELLLI
jgi:hypothetical protein